LTPPDADRYGDDDLPRSVVVCGPTAAGKTDVALALARRFDVQLISADSVQVYRHMDVGTAKPDRAVLARFPHALIDIRDPEHPYSAADFAREAAEEMRSAARRGSLPVIVGGTALYLRALRWGLDAMPAADAALRRQLQEQADRIGWAAMHARLSELDPESAERIAPNDPQRVQRALEITLAGGRPASAFRRGRGRDRLAGSLMLVICPPHRSELHRRIDARLGTMFEHGLVSEAERLMARPGWRRDLPAMRAVGYRQTIEYLRGELDRKALHRRAAAATRQLAKRQLTAFRQWGGAMWYDPLNRTTNDRIIRQVNGMGVSRGADRLGDPAIASGLFTSDP
jgi:tRNA dimethylallyltransferase